MRKQWMEIARQAVTRCVWAAVAVVALTAMPRGLQAAQYNESHGVANRRGDASPTAGASNVDEYTFQDEQVNIDPESGVVRVLRVNQKNLLNDYVTEIIPIRHVEPREIRRLMREICGAEGGQAEVIRDKNKKENFVQVVCPQFQLPWIRAAVAAIDQPWVRYLDDGAASAYYPARFRDVRAVDEIADIYAGDGETHYDLANNTAHRWDEPYRLESWEKGLATADIPVNQVALDLKIYEVAVSNDAKLGLDYIAWKNGPGRNLAGFVLAGMDNHERFTNLSSIYNPIFPRVVNPGPQDLRLVSEFTADTSYGYVSYLLTAAYLDFLVTKNKAKVMASTQLTATSGQGRSQGTEPAHFEAVDDIVALIANPNDPGVEQGFGARPTRLDTPSGTLLLTSPQSGNPTFDADGNPRFDYNEDPVTVDTHIHRRTLDVVMAGKVGVFFQVVPHVAQQSCELEIEAGVSSVAGNTPEGLPILSQRTMTAQVVARDGQPLVLAGLTRKIDIRNNARMPILGKIPIIGYLVGGETDAQRETQVVFVIRPTIIALAPGEDPALYGAKLAKTRQGRDGTIRLAGGEGMLKPPSNPMGFDQWLFDREQPAP